MICFIIDIFKKINGFFSHKFRQYLRNNTKKIRRQAEEKILVKCFDFAYLYVDLIVDRTKTNPEGSVRMLQARSANCHHGSVGCGQDNALEHTRRVFVSTYGFIAHSHRPNNSANIIHSWTAGRGSHD